MTWHKKIPARFDNEAQVELLEGDIQLSFHFANGLFAAISLTVNQAGDLAHALQEAIQHAQEAKP